MSKIYTIGETTYDIIFRNGQPSGAVIGGSVLNTSITLGRLGIPVEFISRMGNDHIGDLSLEFLNNNGVKCNYITRFDGNSRLALAFMDNENNADFQFYKAEKTPSLNFPELEKDNWISFGSTNALSDEGRNELLIFLNKAHDINALTFYDPNIREFSPLQLIEVRRKFEENLHLTKILKGSDLDFIRLYETSDADLIYDKINKFGVETLIITRGASPIELRTKMLSLTLPITPIKPINTIGAGDNFTAGLIYGFVKNNIHAKQLNSLSEMEWKTIIHYAIQFSSEVCQSEYNYISKEYVKQFKAKIAH
jgi:fructokinase